MTQALSGAAIAIVIAVFWVLGRPKRTILRSTDTSAIAALNRGQMELVIPADVRLETQRQARIAALPAPSDRRGRLQLLQQLEHSFLKGGLARREAMELCVAWGHRDALPLIRRGLRDADSQVALLAAGAMDSFRGRTSPALAAAQAAKPPRNVSRTR
ncbi:MAG: HEAT repeat domain-containing protein [Cyanobacteria bacterium M_surface_10_m1_298]|nr:HEAT repeat domain-containing protein [Cyanobacteria bacterium M_surface_10_m1_298]